MIGKLQNLVIPSGPSVSSTSEQSALWLAAVQSVLDWRVLYHYSSKTLG